MNGSTLLQKRLIYWATKRKNFSAIIETETHQTISYQELLKAVTTIRSFLGNRPKKVMLITPGSSLNAIVWVGALTGGHSLIPVSPSVTVFEYKELIAKHNPDIVISDVKRSEDDTPLIILNSDNFWRIIKEKKRQKPLSKPKDGNVLLTTSGSTGIPKSIKLSATKIVITSRHIAAIHELTEHDRVLTPLPFHHVNAPVVGMITSVLTGGTMVIAPKFSKRHFWLWVKKYDPTWISIVPTIATILLQTERPAFLDRSSLRFVRTASAPLPIAVFKRFEEQFRLPLIETYGTSEAASTIAANPLPPKPHKAGSVGLPLGVSMRICVPFSETAKWKDVPQGEEGEICIKGKNVISEYENNEGQHAFKDGWLRTGDLGYMDNDGYVFITGRIKDVINRGGENIAPREIEEVLLTFRPIQEVVVVGQTHQIYGEQVAAYVILVNKKRKDFSVITEKIKAYAAERLSPEKVPAKIYILEEFPKNYAGKVDKQLLRQNPTAITNAPIAIFQQEFLTTTR